MAKEKISVFVTRYSRNLTKHSYNLIYNASIRPMNYVSFCITSLVGRLLQKAKTTGQKVLLVIILFVSILWISVISYASFYSFYMPTAEISRPVHLSFSVCPEGVGICSFPSANVSLTESNPIKEVLGNGQVYSVILDLEIPDTPVNRNLGMFMVVLRMFDRYNHVSSISKRAALFKYRSIPMRLLNLIVLSPLYFVGFYDEKQMISVELYSTYTDDFYHPSVGANVEIQNHMIQIYSCQLKLYAKFTGLRYLLHYWPITSAFCGIFFNLGLCVLLFATAVYNKRETFEEITQTLSQENAPVHGGIRIRGGEEKEKATNEDKKLCHRSTQTRPVEDNDIETFHLPMLQEPADFGDIADGQDLDFIADLRQRRLQ